MDSSATIGTGKQVLDPPIVKHKPSKGKTIGFAIVIILGLGCLAVAGVGLGGYLQAGSFSSLGQIHSIIMMAAGGGGGIIFLIIGIVGSVKSCRTSSHQQHNRNEGIEYNIVKPRNTNSSSKPAKNTGIVSTVDTHGGLIYGVEAWKIWNVEVLDKVPDAPEIRWDNNDPHFNEAFRENYALLYIPKKVRVNGKNKDLTLKTFKEISGGPFEYFDKTVEDKFGNSSAPGWVLISKKVVPKSKSQDYATQKMMVEAKRGFHMLHALEAAVLNLMIDAFTGKRLHGENLTYTRCVECVDGGKNPDVNPVVAVGFSSLGLDVGLDHGFGGLGVACARRKF
jgi:hypothetical protein